ncbi:MAG: hypothetical protein A49_11700 [Methyloceanibacter sp.]|nr:MAG: hypothetical protein A49_11700 [Methyloceanibacter sp.]
METIAYLGNALAPLATLLAAVIGLAALFGVAGASYVTRLGVRVTTLRAQVKSLEKDLDSLGGGRLRTLEEEVRALQQEYARSNPIDQAWMNVESRLTDLERSQLVQLRRILRLEDRCP